MDTSCQNHSHPKLRAPVSMVFLRNEVVRAFRACGAPPVLVGWEVGLHGDGMAERSYATCTVVVVNEAEYLAKVTLDPAARWLPRANRSGLAYHEAGHALCSGRPGHTEEDADEAAMAASGMVIEYDHRWPGKGLQVLRGE